MKSTWSDFKQADDTIFHPFRKIFYAGTENEYQTLYLSIPKKEGKKPLVIFFHGGGMTGGGRECPGDLFNGEYVIAEPRYRLSPAVHAPAHMEDAASAVQWCFAHAEELNIDKKKIFVGGCPQEPILLRSQSWIKNILLLTVFRTGIWQDCC